MTTDPAEAVTPVAPAFEGEPAAGPGWDRDTIGELYQHLRGVEPAERAAQVPALLRSYDLAVAHDRQPYPTADAYERACAALERHRERADKAEADADELRAQLRAMTTQRDLLQLAVNDWERHDQARRTAEIIQWRGGDTHDRP